MVRFTEEADKQSYVDMAPMLVPATIIQLPEQMPRSEVTTAVVPLAEDPDHITHAQHACIAIHVRTHNFGAFALLSCLCTLPSHTYGMLVGLHSLARALDGSCLEEPVVVAVADPESQSKNTVRHFPDLILPRAVNDMFNAIDGDKFDTMVCCAHQCWSRFVEIVMEPADITQWRASLLGLDLLKTVGPRDKVMFVYDTKCISDSLMMDRIRRPFKHPPSFYDTNFQAILSDVFGDSNEEPTLRTETMPFGFNERWHARGHCRSQAIGIS